MNFFHSFGKHKIGLALGSGGAKGIAHAGVLEVFEKNNIIPSEIAGCSIGSIMGALYASGVSVKKIKEICLGINFFNMWDLFDFTNPAEGGIIKGEQIERFLHSILPVKMFQKLRIPFSCVATDLKTGKPVIFNKGEIIPAIRASISIPGFFMPYEYNGGIYIDGSMVDPVPVDLLLHSQYKIAVVVEDYEGYRDISFKKVSLEKQINSFLQAKIMPVFSRFSGMPKSITAKKANSIDILSQSMDIISRELSHYNLHDSDANLIIRPDVEKIPVLAFFMGKLSYEQGQIAAKAALDLIPEEYRSK